MIRMGSSEIGTSESTGLSSLLYSLNGHLEGIPQFHTHSNHLITDRSILIHWVTPCHVTFAGAKDLNGRTGRIVSFVEETQRLGLSAAVGNR